MTAIRLDCGHYYDHLTTAQRVALSSGPDTIMGSGIKPPSKCPACRRKARDDGGVYPLGRLGHQLRAQEHKDGGDDAA